MKRSIKSRHLFTRLNEITSSCYFTSTQIGIAYDFESDIECTIPITAAIKSIQKRTIENNDILAIEYDINALSGISINDFRNYLQQNMELPVYVIHKSHYHPIRSISENYNKNNNKLIIIDFEWRYEEPEPIQITQFGDYMLVVNFYYEGHVYKKQRYICDSFDAAFLHMKKLYYKMRLEEGDNVWTDKHFPPIKDYVNYWETNQKHQTEFIIYDLRTAQLATPPEYKI